MSELIYNISKEAAAQILWISTRTVDRYISSNKLTTKKIWNKVMLAQEEIMKLKSDFEKEWKSNKIDIISENNFQTIQDFQSSSSWQIVWFNEWAMVNMLNKSMDEKFDKFFTALDQKDKVLEERNKAVLVLQNRVIELEAKIQTMIALPDYNSEKAKIIAEKETLKNQIENLSKDLKIRKTENNIYMILFVIIWLLLMYFIISGR